MIKYYHPSDADIFKFRDMNEIKNILSVDPEYLQNLAPMAQGNVFTIWYENEPVAICGWTVSLYGNACLFMTASAQLKKNFCKEIMTDFKKIAAAPMQNFKRTECFIAENNTNKRFIEFLGFHQEAKLKNYDFDGQDMYLYVYVNKGKKHE